MPKIRELAIITARLFQPGAPCVRKHLLQIETDLWCFGNRDAQSVWDVVEDEHAPASHFDDRAIHISIAAAPSPAPRSNGMTYLDSLLFERNPDEAIAPSSTVALAYVAKRRLLDVEGNEVRFYGLFELELPDVEDRLLDASQIRAIFLGELDFNRSLKSLTFTVTTAEQEGVILAAMRNYRVSMRALRIADATNIPVDNLPLLALENAGLISADCSGPVILYSLTDRAKKGLL